MAKWLQYRAVCPKCHERVPFVWCIFSRTRPCPVCNTRIRPDPWWDRISSAIIGTFSAAIGLTVSFVFLPSGTIPALILNGIVAIIVAASIGSLIFFALYPYFMPYITAESQGFEVLPRSDAP